MSIIKLKHIVYFLTFFAGIVLFSACEDEDDLNPAINVIYSSNTELSDNTGYPGNSVIAEGEDLRDIESIVFDDKINVVFNPVLNSDIAIKFTVPFEEANGSRFGKQLITFTNKDGQKFQSEFEILQPNPTLASKNTFDPERPTVGTSVVVNGEWFFDVKSVTFGGEPMEFTQISSTQLSFVVPEDATGGADVVVETVVGESDPMFMDIYLGFDVVLITNFDGEGLRPDNNWTDYGDRAEFGYSDVNGTDGNYAYLVWEGATANGYNGSQSATGNAMLEETDPYKVSFAMDVNCDGMVGTIVDVYIVDGEVNWAYTFTIEEEGWQTIEGLVADFGYNYNASNQSNGDADPSKLNQVKIAINQNAETPNPSKVQFDNLRWFVYEKPQESTTGPANILANGDLEEGADDDFDAWGKWNGGDRMTAETTEVYKGSRALKVVNPAAGNQWDTQFVSDPAETEVDVTYVVTMMLKGDPASVRISTNADAGAQYGPDYTITEDWGEYSWEFTANDTATRIALDMGASEGTFYVDDIKLYAKE